MDAFPFEGAFVVLGAADGEGGLEEGLRAVDDEIGEDVVGEGAVMGYAVVDFGGDGDEEGSVGFELFGGDF